jgi:putative transposon-encoded protein
MPPSTWTVLGHHPEAIVMQARKESGPGLEERGDQVRLTMDCKEMIYKKVARSGRSGRVDLPLDWVGKSVKVVRID